MTGINQMKKKVLCKYFRYSSIMLMLCFIAFGIVFKNYNIILIGLLLLYLQNVLYCLENIQNRIYLLIFYAMIFVFLLSRPTIDMFCGVAWWNEESLQGTSFALSVIFVSLISLQTGAFLLENLTHEYGTPKVKQHSDYAEQFSKNLQIVSSIIFYISIFFYMIVGTEKLMFMQGRTYTEYYSSFQSHLPGIIHTLSYFMVYSLCIFLSTFPEKRRALIPLGLYWVSAIPDLLIGIRNPIMLHSLFIFLYFVMRDLLNAPKKWIGKFEKIGIAIMVPFTLVFMAAYTYLRSGESVSGRGIGSLFVNFFYGQGVTFKVLAIGYECIPFLPARAFRNYTFGGFIDYFLHGGLAQKFLGAEAFESGNNLNNALLSNRFAHNMSYIAKGDKYLQGEGWGSSYLLETYTDYGYLGVIVFSMILGALLVYGTFLWKKRSFGRIILLLTLTQIYFMPRSGATECIEFLIAPSFWIAVAACYAGAGLCCKRYERKKILPEVRNV